MEPTFGQLLRRHRLQCTVPNQRSSLSQGQLAEYLEQEIGLSFTAAAVSNWERDKRRLHQDDRLVLVGIIKVLYRFNGLHSIDEAQTFVGQGNYRLLQPNELRQISSNWEEHQPIHSEISQQLTSTAFSLPLEQIPNPASLPMGSYLPFRPNPFFIGREKELLQMAQALQPVDDWAGGEIVAAIGLGGLGKTQLAVEFAHRYGRYFPGGVFWFNFEQTETIGTQFANCGRSDRLALQPNFNNLTRIEQIQLVKKAWESPIPRLLIFDGCEEETILLDWRPSHGGCRIIMTSRRGRWSPTLGVTTLPLGILQRKASITLLQQFRSKITYEEANNIAKELGDLPLALHLAGSFLAAYIYEVSPKAYFSQLQQMKGGKLLQHPSLQGFGTDFSPTEHELHVAKSFALSYEKLDSKNQQDALALSLLARAAYFAPAEPIPRHLLFNTIKNKPLDTKVHIHLLAANALSRLESLGLIQIGTEGQATLHLLLVEFIQGVGEEPDAQAIVEQTVCNIANKLNDESNIVELNSWQIHLHHITEKAIFRTDELGAQLGVEWGKYLILIAEYNQAHSFLEKALIIFKQTVGLKHPMTAKTLYHTGEALFEQGQYDEARSFYEKALATQEKLLGKNHLDTARSLNNLGSLLRTKGEFAQARDYFDRALAVREKMLGNDHIQTASTLQNLGALLFDIGDYEKSRHYSERALAIKERVLGEFHIETAKSLNNLGILLTDLEDYDGAKRYYQRALTIIKKLLGTNHTYTAVITNNLGLLLNDMGDYDGALDHYNQALTIKRHLFGEEHPSTAMTLNNLGRLLINMGNFNSAQNYYERTLAIREKMLGLDHPETATILQNLAILQTSIGNYTKAKANCKRALAIREQVLGKIHPDTAMSLSHMGTVQYHLGNFNSAQSFFEQALHSAKESVGQENSLLAFPLDGLGLLFKDKGNLPQAYNYLERALDIRQNSVGHEHPQTAQSFNHFGQLLQTMGRFAESQSCFEQALAIQEKKFGLEHPDTAITLHSLGSLYQVQGNLVQAEKLLNMALDYRKKILGYDHIDTAETLFQLGALYQAMGDLDNAKSYLIQALPIFEQRLGEQHEKSQVVRANLQELDLDNE